METAQFENVIFLHICRNPYLFKTVDDDFFKNPYIQKLYKLTKSYHTKFHAIPFRVEDPQVDQIGEIAARNVQMVVVDNTLTKQENLQYFINNVTHIIKTDYSRYDPAWLSQQIKAWVEWENWQKGFRLSLEYQKTQTINADNVAEVVRQCKTIIASRSNVTMDDDLGHDFYDPNSHVQLGSTQFINSGFPLLNQWLSGMSNGGFEPGTLTMFWAAPNVGKCCEKSTEVSLRNIKTGQEMTMTIGEFHDLIAAQFPPAQ